MNILLYTIAAALLIYIIVDVCKSKKFSAGDALAALGIVVTVIAEGTIHPSPPTTPTLIPTAPTSSITTTTQLNVYDNFDNPVNDGSFDQKLWRLAGTSHNLEVQQQGGILSIINSDNQKDSAAVLVARKYDGFGLDSPIFVEAGLAYPESGTGGVSIGIYNTTMLEWGDWSALCSIYYDGNETGGNCTDSRWPQQASHSFETPWQNFDSNTWHSFRIDVDPMLFTITYFVDGIEVGSHVPVDAEILKQANFQFAISSWKSTTDGTVTGQFDNVQIGKLRQ